MNIGNIKEKIKKNTVLYGLLYPVVYFFRFIIFSIRKFIFQTSKYSSKLKNVKAIATEKHCFVIGNGPSLTLEDLEKLHSNGDVCFASNGICGIFDKTEWKPDVYAMHDGTAFEMVQEYLPVIADKISYVFLSLHEMKKKDTYRKIEDENNIFPFFFNQFDRKVSSKNYVSFSHDISKCIGDGCTVTCTLIQIAAYMGYTEIYLLGVDHNYNYTDTDSNGEINDADNHFAGAVNIEKKFKPNQGNKDVFKFSTMGYELCKNECSKVGVNIYNATRGGKLEVFERVDFDSLFEK